MLRIGAGVLLVAVLAVGGCTGGGAAKPVGSSAASSSAAASPSSQREDAAAALVAAVSALQSDTYRVTSNFGDRNTMSGVVDPATGNSEVVIEGTTPGKEATMTVRTTGGVAYLKIKMANPGGRPGVDGKKWRKVAKTGPFAAFAEFDLSQTAAGLEFATEVQWVDADTVKGRIDLAKVIQAAGVNPDTGGRPAETKMPFEASFDSAGRLADYRFTPDGAGAAMTAARNAVKFSDFGASVDLRAPAASEIMTD